ncbi:UNVERIFIED_CONTAM: glycosyltransferase involved in cell wall biosynthesis [Williamsia faeni]
MDIQMAGSEWFGTSRGGLNRYFTDLAQALIATEGVDVSAFAFGRPPAGAHSWGAPTGSTLSRVRASMSPSPRPGTIVDRHFALYGPPVLGRRRGTRLVTHFHGPWAAESAVGGENAAAVRAKYLWERRRYAGSDLVVVLTEYVRNLLVNDYRVDPAIIEVIPPGVDLERFSLATDEPSADRPIVLCVRRLERRMGIDVLIDAWGAVRAEIPDAELLIVGTGTEGAALREQAAGTGCGESVSFAGNASDIELADAYRQATVTVVPTRALEGFGLIALESLAAGRAPIVTDTGGLPDSVRGFDDSLIVPSEDTVAIADRLVRAIKGERPSAAECRSRAAEFTWDRCVDRHLKAYSRFDS